MCTRYLISIVILCLLSQVQAGKYLKHVNSGLYLSYTSSFSVELSFLPKAWTLAELPPSELALYCLSESPHYLSVDSDHIVTSNTWINGLWRTVTLLPTDQASFKKGYWLSKFIFQHLTFTRESYFNLCVNQKQALYFDKTGIDRVNCAWTWEEGVLPLAIPMVLPFSQVTGPSIKVIPGVAGVRMPASSADDPLATTSGDSVPENNPTNSQNTENPTYGSFWINQRFMVDNWAVSVTPMTIRCNMAIWAGKHLIHNRFGNPRAEVL